MKKAFRSLGLATLACLGLLTATRDAHALKIALEAAPGSCVTVPTDVYARLNTLLTARGHTVTVVSGPDIDTLAEISAYNVVAFGGGNFSCAWDWTTFDAILPSYVQQAGGGVVVTGWGAYYMASNPKAETYPGLETVLPMLKGTDYLTGGTIDIIAGHPITQGISSFPGVDYNNHGMGIRPGATALIQQNNIISGAAWTLGAGRSVYLGPIYLADWANYLNEALLDGSQPNAQNLLIQAIEWAGGGVLQVDSDNDSVPDATDNCPNTPNMSQIDADADGVGNVCDNCPLIVNLNQMDGDGDGVGNVCDNCVMDPNPTQTDKDMDGLGDACDDDDDNDGVPNPMDNCPMVANPGQLDADADGMGDFCDPDDDNDTVIDTTDNCPLFVNTDQLDSDNDMAGDACDADDDNDSVLDAMDNCILVVNPDQLNTDSDGMGDACDNDDDDDGDLDIADNCQTTPNPDQIDTNSDGAGDECDNDDDGDGVLDITDNCRTTPNSDQLDTDKDTIGDACDDDDDNDGVADSQDECPLIPNPCPGMSSSSSSSSSSGAGGEGGSAGMGGMGGMGGTGGSGEGGSGNEGGNNQPVADGGCSCRVESSTDDSTNAFAVFGLVGLLAALRRRIAR